MEQCIIFCKGLKPIRDEKYFYFKDNKMSKLVQRFSCSHVQYVPAKAKPFVKWSVDNLYNKTKPTGNKQLEKVESLDDIFENEVKSSVPKKKPVDPMAQFKQPIESSSQSNGTEIVRVKPKQVVKQNMKYQ